ncbi:6068_t:CDS:10, partial [Acaulospora colombiana]
SKEQEFSTLVERLNSTLEGLRVKYVDPVIRENAIAIEQMSRVNSSNTLGVEEKASLYDYVEEQGVQELKIKTQEEVAVIKHCHNMSSKMIENIDAELKRLDDMLMSNNISLEESGVDFSHKKFDTLEQVTHSMAETLESLARHYDQATTALKSFQTQSDAESLLDISVLEEDNHIIPSIVKKLKEDVQFIESISEEVRVRKHIYKSSYEDANKLFTEVDGFGSHMENYANTMKELQADFERGSAVLDRLLEELLNLDLWYEEFSKAYDYMIVEIDRRHGVKEQHKKIAEEYLAKLERFYHEEAQQRDIFYQNHGRYLPVDLCPPILDPPVRYGIVPQEESRLPILSPKTLSEAQEHLLRYQGERRIF